MLRVLITVIVGDLGRMPDGKKYDFGIMPGWSETRLTGCIGEIIGFYGSLTDKETSYIHQYLMTKWGITKKIAFQHFQK